MLGCHLPPSSFLLWVLVLGSVSSSVTGSSFYSHGECMRPAHRSPPWELPKRLWSIYSFLRHVIKSPGTSGCNGEGHSALWTETGVNRNHCWRVILGTMKAPSAGVEVEAEPMAGFSLLSHGETFSENHSAYWGLIKMTNVTMPSACLLSQALWDFSAKSHVVEGKQNLSYGWVTYSGVWLSVVPTPGFLWLGRISHRYE